MSKVNLKHIAEALNVSIATVSKALRNSYEIGGDTKKLVMETAQRMGYSPNPYAGFLRNHKSKTIGLVIPEIPNNFFIQVISGAESIARQHDYHTLIYITHDNFQEEESILKQLQNGRVDGVIMSLSGTTKTYDHLNELILSHVPIIFFDRICHEIETAKITTDDFASGFKATEHLIRKGSTDIAYLAYSENLTVDSKRKNGYLEALGKHGMNVNEARIITCNSDEKGNYKKIKTLLQGDKKPDAIFASVEKLALTCYHVCNDLKIKIPDTVKVLSFSNLRTATLLNPSLTTITQPAFEMGKQAATILFKYLGKKRVFIPNENIVLKSELMERDSTKQID